MMFHCLLFIAALTPWVQARVPAAAATPAACLTSTEKSRLASEVKIDRRIRMYREISERLHKMVENRIKQQAIDEVIDLLSCWKQHLAESLKDIEGNVNRKKKSGALIDYEIQLRKSILDMGNARLKAPYPQQAAFESWIGEAGMVRKKFVDILFQRQNLPRQ
jgi:hypothetical protein